MTVHIAPLHITITARANTPHPQLPLMSPIDPMALPLAKAMAAIDRVMREPLPDISGLSRAVDGREAER